MAVLVVSVGVIALRVLLGEADTAVPADRPALRIDAIKTALTMAAGFGGAAALLLAARRQWLSERAQGHAELDASERRVTDLYTSAVEQLGSSHAAVRLGGLYALERVAQGNPQHRQTIVDVLSAYLRMPVRLTPRPVDEGSTDQAHDRPSPADRYSDNGNGSESQVRMAAQTILTRHLCRLPESRLGTKASTGSYWGGIRLDLTGATLIDWDFAFGDVNQAVFRFATFHGDAIFTESVVVGDADFASAVFNGDARFGNSQLGGPTTFESANFGGDAAFGYAVFAGPTSFSCATFRRPANFGWAVFRHAVTFDCATFEFGRANFEYARLGGECWFDHAQVDGAGVRFWRTTFGDVATFCGARGSSQLAFLGASFHGPVGFEATEDMSTIRFVDVFVLAGGDRAHDVWPEEWTLADHDTDASLLVLRRGDPAEPSPMAESSRGDA